MSNVPWKREVIVSIKLCLWGREQTSHTEPVTGKPLAFQSNKHTSMSDFVREHICTIAPSPTSSSTIACLHVIFISITKLSNI